MNMKRTIPLFTSAVVALLAAGHAHALDVYVSTAGSNDNDGSDRDHALLSISDAYARVAAAGGGTVHVAGGIYRSTQGHFTAGGSPFVPANDVVLAGSADPDNPTIITGDKTLDNKWEDNSPQWIDGVLQLPPEDACLRPSAVGANDSNFLVATAAATNCVFRDLTVHGFSTGGISLDGAENVRFENCRFVGIGITTAHPTGSCLTLANGAGVVSNCLFAGHNGGLKLNAAEATAFTVADSRFRSGVNTGAYNIDDTSNNSSPGVAVLGAAAPVFTGCTFEYLKAVAQNLLFAGSTPWATFTNCAIGHCAVETTRKDRSNILSQKTSFSLVGCRFAKNTVTTTTGGNYCTAACLRQKDGDVVLRDCTFTGNTLEQPSGAKGGSSMASVAAIVNPHKYQVANCAFVSNAVHVAAEEAPVCTLGGSFPPNTFFANCVFRDNDCISGGTRKPEFKSIGMGGRTAPIFVNTVIWHEAADYVPFLVDGGAATGTVGIASCIIKGFDAPAASGNGFKYGLLDDNPRFAASDAASGILSTPKLTGASPALARHGAVKVCEATDGKLYFLDTNKNPNVWRLLGAVNSGSLSLAQGEAVGLFAGTPSIPDIFGNPRAAKAPIGPYALCPSPATVFEVH